MEIKRTSMHIMYVGSVGAGKTYCAVSEALKSSGDFIYTNQPFNLDSYQIFCSSLEVDKKTIVDWTDFSNEVVVDSHCGVLLIDEAPLWLDARKWDSLSPDARRKIVEHRKDDLIIISTAQDISFVDKVYRLLTDEVRLVRSISFPFIGWIWPYCKRPSIICSYCGKVRRDGVGDDSNWLKRLFGFGTFYRWNVYSPKILAQEQSVSGDEISENRSLGSGRRLFDIRVANVYDTSKKLSQIASDAVKQRHAHKWQFGTNKANN